MWGWISTPKCYKNAIRPFPQSRLHRELLDVAVVLINVIAVVVEILYNTFPPKHAAQKPATHISSTLVRWRFDVEIVYCKLSHPQALLVLGLFLSFPLLAGDHPRVCNIFHAHPPPTSYSSDFLKSGHLQVLLNFQLKYNIH